MASQPAVSPSPPWLDLILPKPRGNFRATATVLGGGECGHQGSGLPRGSPWLPQQQQAGDRRGGFLTSHTCSQGDHAGGPAWAPVSQRQKILLLQLEDLLLGLPVALSRWNSLPLGPHRDRCFLPLGPGVKHHLPREALTSACMVLSLNHDLPHTYLPPSLFL